MVVLRPDLRVVFFLCVGGRNEESGRTGGRSWAKMLCMGMGGVSNRLVVCFCKIDNVCGGLFNPLALLLFDVLFRN